MRYLINTEFAAKRARPPIRMIQRLPSLSAHGWQAERSQVNAGEHLLLLFQ